jgi:hypothetical protein
MKNLIVIAAVSIIAGCDNDKPLDLTDIHDSTVLTLAAPLKVSYLPAFEIGDTLLAQKVHDLWKDRETAGMSHPDFFADSVTCVLFNGNVIRGNRDHILSMNKVRLSSSSMVKNEVHTMVSLKNKDKDEDCVIIWGKEWVTKNGRTDSVELVEEWRIKNGKVSDIVQYGRKANP